MFFPFIKIWQSEVEDAPCLKFYVLQNPYVTSTFYFYLLCLTIFYFIGQIDTDLLLDSVVSDKCTKTSVRIIFSGFQKAITQSFFKLWS